VAATSHKAINNLLAMIDEAVSESVRPDAPQTGGLEMPNIGIFYRIA